MFPSMVIRYNMGWYEMLIMDVPLFIGATMSVCSFYLMSQREIFGDELALAHQVPARGAVGGHRPQREQREGGHRGAGRLRLRVHAHPEVPRGGGRRRLEAKRYRGSLSFWPFIELLLGVYFTVMAYYAAVNGIYGTLPFIFIFQFGFLYAAVMSLFQGFGLDMVREQEA